MSGDVVEGLPEVDTPAEVLGTMHYVLHALGRELGERYDAHLTATIGPNWAQALGNIRRQHINKYDPHFVLAEPLKYPDSPTRACLPTGAAFYNSLEDALQVRNAWSHHEVAPLDLPTLKASVATIHGFATAAELQLGKLCSEVKKRINAIANGNYPAAGDSVPAEPPVEIDLLMKELADAKANEAALKRDAAAALALLDEAAEAGAAKAELEHRIAAIQARLDQALDDKQKLEFVIEALASAETTASDRAAAGEGEWVVATPGHAWPGPIPQRKVTMMTLHPDLFDEQTRQRVAGEYGPEASPIIANWKASVAPNAIIFLTTAGQAMTYINGAPIYLGSLGESQGPSADSSEVVGFFIPRRYTLRLNGSIEDRDTNETLADANPAAASSVGGRLLDVLPTGGRLRVTTSGMVARCVNGRWLPITSVEPAEWFPGHLTQDV